MARKIPNAIPGRAVIQRVEPMSMTLDGNPELRLDLIVQLPDRDEYPASHSQVVSQFVMHTLEPGRALPVRVDPDEPTRLELG